MAVQCWSELDLRVPGLALKNPTQPQKKQQHIFFGGGGGGVISFALNMYFPPIMLI